MSPSDDPEARRRAEEPPRQSEERFRLLVEGVKEYAIFMLDEQGNVTTWNEGARRIKGYRAEEVLGRHCRIFHTEEDIARRLPEEELRIAAAEGTYEAEGLRVRKDGARFWASVVITALRDEEGNLRGFAKVTRDITERREAEERERLLAQEQAAREQVSGILESISDAFYAVDEEWRFTYVNGKAEELWGRSREELLGKNSPSGWLRVLHPAQAGGRGTRGHRVRDAIPRAGGVDCRTDLPFSEGTFCVLPGRNRAPADRRRSGLPCRGERGAILLARLPGDACQRGAPLGSDPRRLVRSGHRER